MRKNLVNVAFPLPLKRAFTYHVPDELAALAQVGCRVIAPFGPRKLTGFIVDLPDTSDLDQLKDIVDVLDVEPLISAEQLKLARWISDYYLCALGEALRAMVPATFLQASKKTIKILAENAEQHATEIQTSAPRQAQILRYVAQCQKITEAQLKRKIGAKSLVSSINHLEERGLLQVVQNFTTTQAKPKIEKYVRLIQSNSNENLFEENIEYLKKKAPKQAHCLAYLQKNDAEVLQSKLLKQTNLPLTSLKSLIEKKLVAIIEKKVVRDYYENIESEPPGKIQLNAEQATVVKELELAIDQNRFQAFLLFGVTGSGKTQVYIEAIYKVLEKGKDAIVLVPEISLTPQTVRRFRSHFKDQVAVLHSAMSQGERYDSWHRLKEGKAKVAIGPRSAVFAPLKNIGLIVVDEEHEGSYKQDSDPRYNARDIAVVRTKLANAIVILGSATPSAESYYNTENEKYRLLELKRRVNNVPLPEVKIVDMLKEKRMSGKNRSPVLSRLLAEKIEHRIAKKEQTILLLNRRGFSSYIKCRDCGFVENCEHCNITLTYHLSGRRLRCHYCGFSKRAPEQCPECSGKDILFRGVGTQQVEEHLKERFPEAGVVRMDLDTTGRKWSHDKILQDFGAGKYDILLGTQMVAKGLDFHKVTLVGVINADVGMLIPDFRSSERTFQLLTQVAGRAGRRDLPGEVIIQTFSPDNFCLDRAQQHDFLGFYAGEILGRKELEYPPFGRLICILFKGEDEKKVMQAAQNFSGAIRSISGPFQVLGPIPSPIAKIQNKYRWQILVKGNKEKDLSGRRIRNAVLRAEELFKKKTQLRGVQINFDVDPMTII